MKQKQYLIRDWLPIHLAPKNATWIEVELPNHQIEIVHWASDLSGEEQPPFEGWFKKMDSYYSQVPNPIAWRPLPLDHHKSLDKYNLHPYPDFIMI